MPAKTTINALRALSIDAVQLANSGHPGLPLGAAPMAYVLWQRHLRFHPGEPAWPNRDRFVLSPGHGSMLLYSLLHVYGYDLPTAELKRFRQLGSRTPGHPEAHLTPGVEATTGPLGQGTANSVGMALAERFLHAHTRGAIDHFTYAIVSDGDIMEGICAESAALAGHWGLGKLIWLYDANDVTLDGPAALCFSEDVAARFAASGWHIQTVHDGDHDLEAIDRAIIAAKAEAARPSLIIVRTTIGYGSPNKSGKSDCHGSPLGEAEVARTKQALGWDHPPFVVPAAVYAHAREAAARGKAAFADGMEPLPALPANWRASLPRWQDGMVATRTAAGKVLAQLAENIPTLLGGDADLSCSTKTALKDPRRNLHYGVREHAMGGIANGMAYHGGVRTFTATFLTFSDYMRPAIRLAAMNNLPVAFVFTHDSVGLGEDGPTHQPIEHVMSLRLIPGLDVFRPADANEARVAWEHAMTHAGPVALILSRQDLPVLDAPSDQAARGAYVVRAGQAMTLLATGSEVSLALAAAPALDARVVSMPCWELFARQDAAYQQAVLGDLPRVAIEAGVSLGWERYAATVVGIDDFGASAPADQLFAHLGFTAEQLVARLRS
jgi:transketolase